MSKSRISEEYNIKLGNINITLWQENGKIKQTGLDNYGYPEYIAEFKDTYEGRKQAESYIHGMIQGIECLRILKP